MQCEDRSTPAPRKIEQACGRDILFSICTLVTDQSLYRSMCGSLRRGGFAGDDVEFLYIDNTSGNTFDACAGLNCLLSHACGRYVIFCHQDIVLLDDDRAALVARLGELDSLDPAWALAGNAGGTDGGDVAIRITDRLGRETAYGEFPQRIRSLDENFIVMRSESRLGFSRDIEGFHFYGTDICLQAELRGWNAYVIDFHLRHDGQGTMDENFWRCRDRLEEKYGRLFRARAVRTTCTTVSLVPSTARLPSRRWSRRLRWYRRAIWKWVRGKPVPPRD